MLAPATIMAGFFGLILMLGSSGLLRSPTMMLVCCALLFRQMQSEKTRSHKTVFPIHQACRLYGCWSGNRMHCIAHFFNKRCFFFNGITHYYHIGAGPAITVCFLCVPNATTHHQ